MNITSRFLLALTAVILLTASSCEDDDPFTLSEQELADRIRANTPTELPPITTTGENTMGAWIHPQPGSPLHDLEGDSILFVASGVDRPETALATSLDCDAFDNYLFQSKNLISVQGQFCERPEIGDVRNLSSNFSFVQPDSVEIFFGYVGDRSSRSINYWTRGFVNSQITYTILLDDQQSRVFSGRFSGRLINRAEPFDTLRITAGRFDVTYGITP